MVVSYYIEFFRTGADRHNGILMSLLLLVTETKNCFSVHVKWVVTISSLLILLLKARIQYRRQNRIGNYYHHDGEQLGLDEKVYIKTQSKKKDNLVIFTVLETKNSNLFDKTFTHNVKCHIQERWLRWIVV